MGVGGCFMSAEHLTEGPVEFKSSFPGDDAEFTAIVQDQFDANYQSTEAPQEPDVAPFGLFTEGAVGEDASGRAAMASSTGYTGNNGEESA